MTEVKIPRLFLLRCPQCRNTQKYHTYAKDRSSEGKSKRCVYCGRSFTVAKNIVEILG